MNVLVRDSLSGRAVLCCEVDTVAQREQPLDDNGHVGAFGVALERKGRLAQQFPSHARCEVADDGTGMWIKVWKARQRTLHLRVTDCADVSVKPTDGRGDATATPPLHVPLRFLIDDRLGLSEIAHAIGAEHCRLRLDTIEVDEPNARHQRHRRMKVSGEPKVDAEQGAAVCPAGAREERCIDDGCSRPSTPDDDVGVRERIREIIPGTCSNAMNGRELDCAIMRSIQHSYANVRDRRELADRRSSRLTGAENDHARTFESVALADGELNRDGCDRLTIAT